MGEHKGSLKERKWRKGEGREKGKREGIEKAGDERER